jgi:hypothetical protein
VLSPDAACCNGFSLSGAALKKLEGPDASVPRGWLVRPERLGPRGVRGGSGQSALSFTNFVNTGNGPVSRALEQPGVLR